MRRSSTWTPAAGLFVIGALCFMFASTGGSANAVKYGVMCWLGALGFAAIAFYIHWQGWGD